MERTSRPTVNLELNLSHKNKDGGIPVQIRVTKDRRSVRMATSLTATSEDMTKQGKLKGNLKYKAEDLLRKVREIVSEISFFSLQEYSVEDVVEYIRKTEDRKAWKLDFFVWAEEWMAMKKMADSTRKTYEVAIAALKRFKGPTLDCNEIKTSLIQDFVVWLENEPKHHYDAGMKAVVATASGKASGATINTYIRQLKTIYNAAKARYNDEDTNDIRIFRNPFSKVVVPNTYSHGQKPLDVDTLRALITSEAVDEAEREALDVAILSFALMGINMADLYFAFPPINGIFTYNRKKTRDRRADEAFMRMEVPEEVEEVVNRLKVGAEEYRWINLSHRYATVQTSTQSINRKLKAWAVRNGIDPFTFYSIRKTWATIARSSECGIGKDVVDECLGHVGDYKIADIYIQKDWSVISNANRKVLEFVFSKISR